MKTRRDFIKTIGLTGSGVYLGNQFLSAAQLSRRVRRSGPANTRAAVPGGTLDPSRIHKYARSLFVLPAMPRSNRAGDRSAVDYYEIAIRQFRQQILPPGLPATTVWGYGSLAAPSTADQGGSFSYPSFSIEAKADQPARVKWLNELRDTRTGDFLPHLFSVDQTLHWANPPGPRDEHTMFPTPYKGPVPLVTHLHGGHSGEESDGYPEAWYLPKARNTPAHFFTEGSFYDLFKQEAAAKYGIHWEAGTATFQYPNDQRATALWFHDHALGMVRQNVYAGLTGFYFLRGGAGDQVEGALPGQEGSSRDEHKHNSKDFEIPLIIQDRSFNSDGSLFYPAGRAFFDGFSGPSIPDSDIPPIWNPEFFGNTIVVNGRTWPFLGVEKRRYRFRILNACNTRFLLLKLEGGLPFWLIGGDGGFLPGPVQTDHVLLAPAERADVIVDFSDVKPGTRLNLLNLAPDEPFGGGTPGVDFESADPGTTGQVMQFRVGPAQGPDVSTSPDQLRLPAPPDLGSAQVARKISFNELDSDVLADVGPRIGLLGLVDLTDPASPEGVPLRWMDEVTESPVAGNTEIWEIYDFTEDAHPFHIHQVQFELLNREVFDSESPNFGQLKPPERSETGRKDTLIVYPGEITRFKARFDLPGRYVWHCHILEHEDNEMMRPYQVLPG